MQNPAETSAKVLQFSSKQLHKEPLQNLTQYLSDPSGAAALRNFRFNLSGGEWIEEQLNRHILGGGKRLRAALALLSWELWADPADSRATVIARASEHIHAAFLTHDDVIDQAHERRGRASFNESVGNRAAVLGGDALLAHVMVEIASLNHVEILKTLAECIARTVEGEIWQDRNRWNPAVTFEELTEIGSRKTGALFSWTAAAPARLLSLPTDASASLEKFGQLLGVLFQMADDALDFEAAGEKEFAKDLSQGLLNTATISLLDCNPNLRPQFQKQFREMTFARFWSEPQWRNSKGLHQLRIQKKVLEAESCLEKLSSFCGASPQPLALGRMKNMLRLAGFRTT